MPLARARKHSLLYAGIRCRPYSTSSFRIDPANGRLDWVATAYLDDEPVFLSTDMSELISAGGLVFRILLHRPSP